MATSPEYRQFVLDLLSPLHPIRTRNMFGGVGIFDDDQMFAMITSDDRLYFKVDDTNQADYESAGMTRFHRMPYFELPPDIVEDTAQLKVWLDKSVDVARRSPKKKKKKK